MSQELCDRGFLERSDDSTLRVSRGFFALPASLAHGVLAQSRPILRRLAVAFGASARLSVLDGVLVRALRTESAAEQRPAAASLVTPCWCTGAGRALLLDHSLEDVLSVLDGYELIGVGGPNAAHSADELVAANERDRPQGMTAAHDEFEHGITEYAAPIRDSHSRIWGAIAVLGRQQDVVPQEEAIRQSLKSAARTLGELLESPAPGPRIHS
ncbi:DNA-binding IclR family transcriptional regulator [Sinomonas atrocyanea]|uniref:IclR family transcriptional regulator domain-containing protein n=1 Tax=Sinomonas atrocyanea TaxID=37927 RepID=UPI0027897879|nr:IclR family transcriptional regulator C-terminal domain-containing protein [Sinomonas atrocyanea]MDP9884596.1 DNA-binding IclR family transcriptional regulator [Sinomonas atrocyanea]